jgi:hypothetical protein
MHVEAALEVPRGLSQVNVSLRANRGTVTRALPATSRDSVAKVETSGALTLGKSYESVC